MVLFLLTVLSAPLVRLSTMTQTTTSQTTSADRRAWGWGLATVHEDGDVLDTWYPEPQLGCPDDSSAPADLHRVTEAGRDAIRNAWRHALPMPPSPFF